MANLPSTSKGLAKALGSRVDDVISMLDSAIMAVKDDEKKTPHQKFAIATEYMKLLVALKKDARQEEQHRIYMEMKRLDLSVKKSEYYSVVNPDAYKVEENTSSNFSPDYVGD